jgi:hypothetical protein
MLTVVLNFEVLWGDKGGEDGSESLESKQNADYAYSKYSHAHCQCYRFPDQPTPLSFLRHGFVLHVQRWVPGH